MDKGDDRERERGGEWRTQWPPGDLADRQDRGKKKCFFFPLCRQSTLDMGIPPRFTVNHTT